MALPIDVGSAATDRNDFTGGSETYIDLSNPANLSGLITSIDIWAYANMTNVRVGVFSLVSGTTYRCRGSVNIGNITAGGKRTIAVNLPVKAGDYIGFYAPGTGRIEQGTSGGSGVRYVTGEYIDAGDSANFSTLFANYALSLFGQGIVKGWSSK